MKILILTCLFQLVFSMAHSQDHGISVYQDEDNEGNYKFHCRNDNYCNYTVLIDFREISNLVFKHSTPFVKEVDHGRNYLFTLEAGDPTRGASFNYDVAYVKGGMSPKVDMQYNYLLPVAAGKPAEVFDLAYLQINEKDPPPKDYYALGIKMEAGDTIFAARRGVVCEFRDTTTLAQSGYVYSSDDNYLEIFQQDGSFARYQVLNKALVEPGRQVEAGDPIAIAGGENYLTGTHVRFFVYYNYKPTGIGKNDDVLNRIWAYVPLKFCTEELQNQPLISGNVYHGVHPDSLITNEMSKRELRRWLKAK